MGCEEEKLVQKVYEIYNNISSLNNLKPSKDVNTLFTQLVLTCMPTSPIDVTKLSTSLQEIRSKLINLCGEADGLLETHFSTLLTSYENPLDHINIFPYYSNYLKLSHLEFTLLDKHITNVPNRVAFIGSGPLPLSSIVLASYHLKTTSFDNYDIDEFANSLAIQLVSNDSDLSKRMLFHTTNVFDISNGLREYEVVFLAALVGMNKEEKAKVIAHLEKYMATDSILMLRSAHGARGFLYPVVNLSDLSGFEVLSVYHPTDEVINSVIVARKYPKPVPAPAPAPVVAHTLMDQQGFGSAAIILPSKCSEIQAFNPLNHGNMIEELIIHDHQE